MDTEPHLNAELLLTPDGKIVNTELLRDGKYQLAGDRQRMFLTVSAEVMNAIGGRDALTREVFPQVFGGSYPTWGNTHSDGSYCVELPGNIHNAALVHFLDAIDLKIPKPTLPETNPEPAQTTHQQSSRWDFWNLLGRKNGGK